MAENRDIFNFELSAEDMSLIASLDMKMSSFFDHRNPKIVQWFGDRTIAG